ncbi:hypothetical protein D3C76_1219750 [compost metagenome]
MVDLNAVSALLLGHVAGHVGGPERSLEAGGRLGDVHHTDAHGGDKWPALPDKMQVLHGLAQTFADLLRDLCRAVFQQDTELVAAQARQGIAFAQA